MPLSIRARETLALVTVVLLVVAVASVAHLASVAQITLRAAADEGRLLARQLYHQSARMIGGGGPGTPGHPGSAGGAAPRPTADALRPDAGLRALVEGMVGYSRVVVYAAVVDPAGRAVVHSDPALEGTTPGPRPALEDVLAWGAPRMAVALLQAPQIYETRLPIRIGERPFGSVRVGVSTSLVRQELREALLRSVALGAGALLVAVGVGLGAGRLLLQSLRRIARRVERLARGEPGAGVELGRGDALGELAERVNRLGERIQAGRAPGTDARGGGDGAEGALVASLVTYAQKLAALGRLTSDVAHEVKNPLNAMRIHLELLRTRLPDAPPAVVENLVVIAQQIQRLDRVVQGFLRFMRPQDLHLARVDLNAVLGDVARLTGPEARQTGVRIALELAGDLLPVTGDAELLQQACANLVTNAIHAMPHGGTLTLSTRPAPPASVRLRVADQGVGIAPQDLERIFRLYYTTKPAGSGLGLSLVYRIVQLHDGRIDVESAPGGGTTMTVTLPLAPPTP